MLALIAGTGALPSVLFRHLSDAGERPIVCALSGFEPEIPADMTFRLEHLGSVLLELRDKGVTQICMAGAVRRPQIDPTEIDAETMPLVPRVQAAMAQGDDGALRIIIELFEERGFDVVGAADLCPDLLPEAGILTLVHPADVHRRDVLVGDREMQAMAAADSGQACVIKDGTVVRREGPEGTAAMLRSLVRPDTPDEESTIWPLDFAGDLVSSAADWLAGDDTNARGGILYKAPKPGQERRADLPVIGPETATQAAAAGLSGIVIEAGGVMVLDLGTVVRTLDEKGLFLWVRSCP